LARARQARGVGTEKQEPEKGVLKSQIRLLKKYEKGPQAANLRICELKQHENHI